MQCSNMKYIVVLNKNYSYKISLYKVLHRGSALEISVRSVLTNSVSCKVTILNISIRTFHWIGVGQEKILKKTCADSRTTYWHRYSIRRKPKSVVTSFSSSVWVGKKYSSRWYEVEVRPYKTTVVHGLLPPDCEAWIRYRRWFQESVFNVFIDPELMLYSEEAWFNLSSHVNSQNNSYWSTEHHHAVHEVSLHNLNAGAINARRIIGGWALSWYNKLRAGHSATHFWSTEG